MPGADKPDKTYIKIQSTILRMKYIGREDAPSKEQKGQKKLKKVIKTELL
jgi:hypothetical protein